MVGLEASRDGRVGLDRLLVELGAVAVSSIEAVGPDRAKVAALGLLLIDQPAQGGSPTLRAWGLPPDRALAIRACGSLALSYARTSSNQDQDSVAAFSKRSISRSVSASRTWLAGRAPENR